MKRPAKLYTELNLVFSFTKLDFYQYSFKEQEQQDPFPADTAQRN